jgi:hypothetical protein
LDNKDPYDPLAKLCGSAEKAWDPQCNEDLISLRTSLSGSTTVVDIFARWAMQVLADKWKNSVRLYVYILLYSILKYIH